MVQKKGQPTTWVGKLPEMTQSFVKYVSFGADVSENTPLRLFPFSTLQSFNILLVSLRIILSLCYRPDYIFGIFIFSHSLSYLASVCRLFFYSEGISSRAKRKEKIREKAHQSPLL